MTPQWYWMQDGQEHGPAETAELKELARNGQLKPTDLIWQEGLPDWVPAAQAKALFPYQTSFGTERPARTSGLPLPPVPAPTGAWTVSPVPTPSGRRRRIQPIWVMGGIIAAVILLKSLSGGHQGGPTTESLQPSLIAFVSRGPGAHGTGKREIYIIGPDGTGQRSLTSQFTDAFYPVWSPDGMRILFQGGKNGDVYVIDSDGRNLIKILDLEKVTPDFPGILTWKLNVSPGWLTTSRAICVNVGSELGPSYISHVYLVGIASGKQIDFPLTNVVWKIVWSPDGARIAFVTFNSKPTRGDSAFQVCVADAKGVNQRPVSDQCEVQDGPLWLPDGARLIFVKRGKWANGRMNNKLCLINIDSGESSETDFAWDVWTMVVSPDGEKIAFSPLHEFSPIHIFRLIGTSWHNEASIENGGFPTWSPDGASIAFISTQDHQIWRANADGTARVQLTPTLNAAGGNAASGTPQMSGGVSASVQEKEWPRWSPGKYKSPINAKTTEIAN